MKRYFVLCALLLCCSFAFADGFNGISGTITITDEFGTFSTNFSDGGNLNFVKFGGHTIDIYSDSTLGLIYVALDSPDAFTLTEPQVVTFAFDQGVPLHCNFDESISLPSECSPTASGAVITIEPNTFAGNLSFNRTIGTPEPASFTLLGVGLLGLLRRKR